jgi:hypothetical protein
MEDSVFNEMIHPRQIARTMYNCYVDQEFFIYFMNITRATQAWHNTTVDFSKE